MKKNKMEKDVYYLLFKFRENVLSLCHNDILDFNNLPSESKQNLTRLMDCSHEILKDKFYK